VSALGDEDVRRLDVAVDDTSSVSGVERVGDLGGQTQQDIGLDGFSGDAMLQRHAVQKLHDEERVAVLLPDFMDRANIGMVQS
jgi:hypothetical protein